MFLELLHIVQTCPDMTVVCAKSCPVTNNSAKGRTHSNIWCLNWLFGHVTLNTETFLMQLSRKNGFPRILGAFDGTRVSIKFHLTLNLIISTERSAIPSYAKLLAGKIWDLLTYVWVGHVEGMARVLRNSHLGKKGEERWTVPCWYGFFMPMR